MSTFAVIFLVMILVFLYLIFGKKSNPEILENDAKRFAKLLISEIKLYETHKVENGLKNKNQILKDEITKARKKFKNRIPNPDLEKFFDDALVEILADGDQINLGTISTSLK